METRTQEAADAGRNTDDGENQREPDQPPAPGQRGDAERTLTVTLGARNQQPYLGIVPCADGQAPMPATVGSGALVVEVEKESAAQKAGLQVGDRLVISEGLQADDAVIVEGLLQAVPGREVNPDWRA